MNISIGILAHNEEQRIGRTLEELLGQSVLQACFADAGNRVEVVCVVNGSTDSTAEVARAAFSDAKCGQYVDLRVVEVRQKGKVNAWNEYVHRISCPDADFLVFMDADIRFSAGDVLEQLVEALNADTSAWASVSSPIKHLASKPRKNLFDRLSLLHSRSGGLSKSWICGQLYCMRTAIARRIVLPRGLLVEDGFLSLMLTSDLFSWDPFEPRQDSAARVIHPPRASHVFEAYTRLGDLLRQGRRQAAAHAINLILREWILANRGEMSGADAIAAACHNDRDWFAKYLARRVGERWWVMPRGEAVGRFRVGMSRFSTDGPMAVLLAVAGYGWAMTTYSLANVHLKRQRSAAGIW